MPHSSTMSLTLIFFKGRSFKSLMKEDLISFLVKLGIPYPLPFFYSSISRIFCPAAKHAKLPMISHKTVISLYSGILYIFRDKSSRITETNPRLAFANKAGKRIVILCEEGISATRNPCRQVLLRQPVLRRDRS